MTLVRSVFALAAGFLVAAILYQIGAALAFLVLYGIPLGYSGAPPGADYYGLNLSFSAASAFVGARVAARLAPARPVLHSALLAAALTLAALWGFNQPQSRWPRWYPAALAVVAAASSLAGGLSRRAR